MKKIVAVLIILLMTLAQATALAAPPRHDRHRDNDRSSRHRTESRQYRTDSRQHQSHTRQPQQRSYVSVREWHHDSRWNSRPVHREYRSSYHWHSHRRHHHGHLIVDVRWNRYFPNYRSYWYEGPGFFYRGIEYRKVVMFYDKFDQLVAFGFWRNGRFVVIRSDDSRFVTQDRFFIDYQDENIRIRIGG